MGGYNKSYKGIGELLRSPQMQAAMGELAERAKVTAISIAPEKTGEYKSRFEVSTGVRHGKTSRAYGRLRNTDHKALWIELGTEDTPRFRVLGRAILALKGK